MKNNLNFFQLIEIYKKELGVNNSAIVEDYLSTIFKKKIDKTKLKKIEQSITTNSPFFPDLKRHNN